jgi:23S rRNA (guanine745-N1)-methyltransferase
VNLLCTVRGCREALERRDRTYACTNGHSFDIARSGYLNLLQPQDRRSKNPGDTSEAVAARRRFFEGGVVTPLVDGIVRAVETRGSLLDVGCGEGHHLEAFRRSGIVDAWGVDISVPAIELAAKSYRQCRWVVANADRFLPFADGTFDAVTSITARMNPEEFHRVLRPDGTLLIVLPGADDLIELREAVLGEAVERDRTERTLATFEPLFRLEHQETLRHTSVLDPAAMHDVMESSYRGLRARERERLEKLEAMSVTLARDLLRFRP